MENLEQEIKSLCQLLNSWQDENIDLAFQIMRGNRKLTKLIKEIYLPLFDFCDKKWRSTSYKALPQLISNGGNFELGIPQSEAMIAAMTNMPIPVIYYINKGFTVLPWWICHLTQLEELYLDDNNIVELPAELYNLERLENLSANHNKLKKLPESIGKLVNLKKLQLDYNQIEELPESIGNMANLEWLCLEKNKIKALPKTSLQLKNLEWLSIEGTPLGKKKKIHYGTYITVGSPEFQKLLD